MLDRILFRFFGDGFEKERWIAIVIRSLLLLLILSLALAVGLYFLGGLASEYEGKVNIEAPADIIFSQLITPENRLEWQTEATSVRNLSSELKSNSRIKLRLKRGNSEVEAVDEVMRIVPEEWFSFRTSTPHLSRVTVFKIKPALDPETELPIPNTLELSCRTTEQAVDSARYWAAFFKPNIKARVDAELAKIKEQAEAAAGSKTAE